MAHPVTLLLREGSKGPLSEEACDPKPVAQEFLDQAAVKPHCVRITVGLFRYEDCPAITLCARHPPQWSQNMDLTHPVAAAVKP